MIIAAIPLHHWRLSLLLLLRFLHTRHCTRIPASDSLTIKCKPRHTLPPSKQASVPSTLSPRLRLCVQICVYRQITQSCCCPYGGLPSLELLVESAYNAMPLHCCSHYLPSVPLFHRLHITLPPSHSLTHAILLTTASRVLHQGPTRQHMPGTAKSLTDTLTQTAVAPTTSDSRNPSIYTTLSP